MLPQLTPTHWEPLPNTSPITARWDRPTISDNHGLKAEPIAFGDWDAGLAGTLLNPLKTERVGFEPTEGFPSNDFESFAFDHSATSPGDQPNPPCE